MAGEAIASGGIIAGGATATLQSVGATATAGALGAGTIAGIAVAGAIAGAGLLGGAAFVAYQFIAHQPDGQTPQQSEGTRLGMWTVITEEGWGQVRFYLFDSKDLAWRYFNDAWHARVIVNEHGVEVEAADGGNGAALHTVRMQLGVSPHNSTNRNGFIPTWLAAGNVIALHSPTHNRFIRMMGDHVDAWGGTMDLDDLPEEWDSERFTLVDAGNGEFALHSATHKRFVRMVDATVDSKGGEKAADELPRGWVCERFTIVDAGGGLIALHSKNNNRFIKMDGWDVNGKGWSGCGRRDAGSLPSSWDSERFAVKLVTAA
jgi:hypothetical protein